MNQFIKSENNSDNWRIIFETKKKFLFYHRYFTGFIKMHLKSKCSLQFITKMK